MKVLVTGSGGLIGSAMVRHFAGQGNEIVGIDNNMRKTFFGDDADTSWAVKSLVDSTPQYRHVALDIRDRESILKLFEEERFDATVHCAAQPSHDRAAAIPFLDFEVNALGTLNLLEANRQYSLDSPFVMLSTNKVYGDGPNHLPLVEQETRYDFADEQYRNGIPETFPIDHTTHSLFGASKVAADVMVQEYGRYFGMPTCCLRGGCLTGGGHSGVELHGFLSYLVKCNVTGKKYSIFGYKGKQVRDNIHSDDVARFAECFIAAPRSGAVYNIGGGPANAVSMMEAISQIEKITGKAMQYEYVDQNRKGDHICYYSDLTAIRTDYPEWDIQVTLPMILDEIAASWQRRLSAE